MAKGRQQYFADEVSIQKEAREFAIEEALKEKIDSIEEGAQVNVIETVKVNGDPLVPDAEKAVDVSVPLVEDTLYSVDTEAALSARQGKVLYDYILNLQSRGRYLSNWNCATGLPTTNPSDSPYEYRAGDYFLVSNVSTGTNYRPDGTQYVIGTASTTVETEIVGVSDMYIYDGETWQLIINSERPIAIDDALSPTSTNPVENRVVTQAIGTKQNIITDLQTIREGAAKGDTAVQPGDSLSTLSGDSDDIAEGSSHLFMTTSERTKLGNQSGVNTGDETQATIMAKLGAASASTNGYLTSTDWNTFNDKQDAIQDLQTIRENATAGKNASDTIATYGDIVTHDASEFASSSDMTQVQGDITSLQGDMTQAQSDITSLQGDMTQAQSDIIQNANDITGLDTRLDNAEDDIDNLQSDMTTAQGDITQIQTDLAGKQDTLVAGANIQIDPNTNTISATDTKYTAGPGISISNNNVISNTQTSAEWGNIQGTLSNQTDLQNALDEKQDKLMAGDNVTIGEVCVNISDMQGPAPKGFHVPLKKEWQGVATIMSGLSLTTGDNWRTNLHLPFTGRRSYLNAVAANQGSDGAYWSSSPYGSSNPSNAYYFYLYSSGVYTDWNIGRANGFSIRCFKDSFVAPTSSWTVIQGTLGNAGIFWNTTDGLISITSNGTTGYTIQDKNLGATTVYSDGDALNEANCGKYYQRGNNYGFAWSGSLTTSSTKVDARLYGPGTTNGYYKSDTFIKGSDDWSSVHNGNLRGGVSQGYTQECNLTISAQVPDSAEWGNITGTLSNQTDLQNALNAKADATDVNTKTFYITSFLDLTAAQAAYDWYLAGKTPLIFWDRKLYYPSYYWTTSGTLGFVTFDYIDTDVRMYYLGISHTETSVTSIATRYTEGANIFLAKNNTTAFTPSGDYNPATKKYVDDAVAGAGGNYTAGNGIDITNNEISVDTSVVATQTDVSNKVSKGVNQSNGQLFSIEDTNGFSNNFGPDYVRVDWTNGQDSGFTGLGWDGVGIVTPNETANLSYERLLLRDESTMESARYEKDKIHATDQNLDSEDYEFSGGGDNQIARLKNTPYIGTSAPSSPSEGRLWYDTTNDVLKSYNGTSWKEAGTQMKVLSYGHSTWQDFINAYNENAIVYCRASSNSNPGTGTQGRMAFMAFVTFSGTTPTSAEFQYYRSRSNHDSAANQLDQVFVYTLSSNNGGTWSVVERNTAAKAVAGTGISLSYGSGNMTISNTGVTSFNGNTGAITLTPGTYLSLNNNVIDVDTSLIATKADLANFAGFLVVAQLPTTDIKTNIIYLLGPVGTGADKYEEYIYSNNNWIMIGDTSIDLSPYFHKTNDDSDDIIEGSTNLFLTPAERTKLSNTSGTNTGDETKTTIQTKLGAASSSNSGYLTSTDWDTFNGKANAVDVNTKTFYLSGRGDTEAHRTECQPIINWRFSGKMPIVRCGDMEYVVRTQNGANTLNFESTRSVAEVKNNKYTKIIEDDFVIYFDSSTHEVTHLYHPYTSASNGVKVIETGRDYSSPYIPEYDGSPATKKYVDDKVSDTAYASSWDGVTTIAPSKDAVYDKISAMDTTIAGKQEILTAGNYINIAPSTYKEAEYLTVSKQDVKFSGFTPTNGTEIEMDFKFTSVPTNGGLLVTAVQGGLWLGVLGGNFVVRTYGGSNYISTTPPAVGTRTKVKVTYSNNQLQLFFDGVSKGTASFTDGFVTSPDVNYLFNDGGSSRINATFYELKISNGNTLQYHFIPAKTDGGTYGLYDIVNYKIYGPNSGNAFTGGNAASTDRIPKNPVISSTPPVTSVNGATGEVSINAVPSGGTTGQVLTKTSNGYGWVTSGGGDMNYSDFGWQAKTGATITLDLASTITPSANFTVNAPSTIKDGQVYVLRVYNGATTYTMTLGSNISNPFDVDLTLTASGIDQFVFLAVNGTLELQPEGGGGGGGGGAITADTTGTTTSISKIWVGTEAEYAALTTYEEGIAYMTF